MAYIQLPPDGAGKKHRSWEITEGADDVHATAGVVTAPDGTVLAEADGLVVQGGVASGATDSGDPVKVGGVYNSAQPTLTDGDRGDLQLDAGGALRVAVQYSEDAVKLADGDGNPLGSNAAGGASLFVADGGGSLTVDGSVAVSALPGIGGLAGSGTAQSGNPVKVGGVYVSGDLALDNDDVADLQLDATGRLLVDAQGTVALDSVALAALESITIGTALPAGNNNIGDVDVASLPAVALDSATLTALETITIGTALPAGTNNIGDVDILTLPALPAGNNNIGDVDIASLPAAGTATLSNVATSNASAQLLAANASRKGAIIYNDSLVVMYVKFGTTASASSFTYYLVAGATLELAGPVTYTGRIDAILASSTGTARVTELT